MRHAHEKRSRASGKAQVAAVHVAAARAAEAEGDGAAAAASYTAAIGADPSCASAHVGLACVMRGDAADEAALATVESHLQRALEAATASGRTDERALAPVARSHLALLLAQAGREEAAALHMRGVGCTYRLAPEVLCYELQPPVADGAAPSVGVVAGLDGALPASMTAHLAACFAPGSPFFREHRYHSPSTGYFSYTHALSGADAPAACAFEQCLAAVRAIAASLRPAVAEATHAEWWAHCRPHSSGHQLHFDSDAEGKPDASGAPRHPVASCVIYLSSGAAERVGGPTLVTTQRRCDSSLAREGHLAFPAYGRLVVFDGSVLHGVVPGRGASPAPGERRTTLMVAFWKGIETVPGDAPGASRPFPDVTTPGAPEWAAQLAGGPPREAWQPKETGQALRGARAVPLRTLPRVWADADEASNAKDGIALRSLAGMPHYSTCFQGF